MCSGNNSPNKFETIFYRHRLIQEIEEMRYLSMWEHNTPIDENFVKTPEGVYREKITLLDKIEEYVELLMIEYGPDGHTDGSYQIAQFIYFLMTSLDKDVLTVLENCDYEKRFQFLETFK